MKKISDTTTYHPITRKSQRGFVIFVSKERGVKVADTKRRNVFYYQREDMSNSHYPYFSGKEAIELMTDIEKRGFDTLAYTAANGIEENISLNELKELAI